MIYSEIVIAPPAIYLIPVRDHARKVRPFSVFVPYSPSVTFVEKKVHRTN